MIGFGSPSVLAGSTFDHGYGVGFGDPSEFSPHGNFGHAPWGHMSTDSYNPPAFSYIVLSDAWVVRPEILAQNTNGEFSDKGGELVHVYSPNKGFPVRGPYRVRLVDVGGNAWPDDADGCYSAIAEGGVDCYTNRSREVLRFAMPIVPIGVYALEISWLDGVHSVTINEAIACVPHSELREPDILKFGFA